MDKRFRKVGPDGIIEFTDEGVWVYVRGLNEWEAAQDGVVCLNPRAHLANRVYGKLFVNKPIYTSFDAAMEAVFGSHGLRVVVLGMNGFSSLNEIRRAELGLEEGSYEWACQSIMFVVFKALQVRFPNVEFGLVDGSSDVGVDLALNRVAAVLSTRIPGFRHLGFSCPRYAMFAKDDNVPLCLASTEAEYADWFVRALDVLIATNGRLQSWMHDYTAAMSYNKPLILTDVVRLLSKKGRSPALDAHGQVQDSVALYSALVHAPGAVDNAQIHTFEELVEWVTREVISAVLPMLRGEDAFSIFQPPG